MATVKVSTKIQPDVILEVNERELADLEAQGLVIHPEHDTTNADPAEADPKKGKANK